MITNSKPERQVDQRPWYDRHTWGSCRDGRDPELCAWCEANPPKPADKHKRVAERLSVALRYVTTQEETVEVCERILREGYPE